jgi:hypothetical protein
VWANFTESLGTNKGSEIHASSVFINMCEPFMLALPFNSVFKSQSLFKPSSIQCKATMDHDVWLPSSVKYVNIPTLVGDRIHSSAMINHPFFVFRLKYWLVIENKGL